MSPVCPKRPIVRAHPDTLRRVAVRHGLTTDQATAHHLGISPATLSRIMHGAPAGGHVIASVWQAFALDQANAGARIDDLFTVHLVDRIKAP